MNDDAEWGDRDMTYAGLREEVLQEVDSGALDARELPSSMQFSSEFFGFGSAFDLYGSVLENGAAAEGGTSGGPEADRADQDPLPFQELPTLGSNVAVADPDDLDTEDPVVLDQVSTSHQNTLMSAGNPLAFHAADAADGTIVSAVEQVEASYRPNAQTLIQGQDTRQHIDGENYNWSYNGGQNFDYMIVKVSTETGYGTGALISPKHMLTNRHVLYENGELSSWNITASVGRDGWHSDHEVDGWNWVHTIDKFETQGFNTDVAIIELDEEIGWETGWFGMSGGSASSLVGDQLFTAGYPSYWGTTQMTATHDVVASAKGNTVRFQDMDTGGGASGSPLFTVDADGGLTIEAIVSGMEEWTETTPGGWQQNHWWELPWWRNGTTTHHDEIVGTNISDGIFEWAKSRIEDDYAWWDGDGYII